jgi:hypothetical protein
VKELTAEMEQQGKRLCALLRVDRLNTMNRDEFLEIVAIADRLKVNLADFNALHFGPPA